MHVPAKRLFAAGATAALTAVCLLSAAAQYPKVPMEVRMKAAAARLAEDARSDAAFQKAMPIIRQWESRGKPYIPWAAKPEDLPQADIPAFPGAQGGGMYSFGGRGGKVYVVTNVNDSGPGSFREAVEAGGPRFVVFNVAGIIKLKSRVRVRAPYITIDGSSAPGDGVCIAGAAVAIDTHDVVIRHMRFRRGETWVGDRDDSLGGHPVGNIMIDHVSASWGLDEDMSVYRHMYSPPDGSKFLKLPTVNVTIQNSIFSEALDTYDHAFGSTLGGYNSTFHHNLWACNTGRNPSVGMIYDFTFVNNVLFNWRHRTVDGGDHQSYYTIVNNYFKPGPATNTRRPIGHRLLQPEPRRSPEPNADFGLAYVAGNVVEGNPRVTDGNWAGGVQVELGRGLDVDRDEVLAKIRADQPYPHAYIETESAEEAYQHVLAGVGATLPKRDAVDQRVVEMVRTGEVTYKEGRGIITDISQVGGYPAYQGEPYKDSDSDGMPDAWETKYGLDLQDPSDSAGDLNGDGYTNIEAFLYELDPAAPKATWAAPKSYMDLFPGVWSR
jgi:pectate lyase